VAEASASCARHGAPAEVTCTHCGDFLCPDCVRTPEEFDLPYCEECLARREAHRSTNKLGDRSTKTHRAALGFGIASLVPCLWFCWVGAFATGVATLRRSEDPQERKLAVIGMALATFGIVVTIAIFVGLSAQ
jgi:hypothetical protein